MPTGTVTFLFTDIQGSTRLWDDQPEAMRLNLARHDALLRRAIQAHGGSVFKTVGDAFCAAFARATDAIVAAVDAQQSLDAEPWQASGPLRVRMAIHSGAAEERDGDYFGPPLNRVARLLAAGHGGQTLLSLAAAELARDDLPEDVSLRDLGQHRLKDLQRPEQVYQLLHAGLPEGFPPLRTLDRHPHNLPVQLTTFIGREREIAEVQRLLDGTRLLTVTGTGGCGKTRLALQTGANRLEEHPDGVWWVELAPLTEPELVPQAVADAVGLREEPGRPLLASLTEYLKPRSLLLVLDNCEHLVHACADLVDRLLRSCPELHLLATSREPLGVAGETTWRAPSFELPSLPSTTRATPAEVSALSQCEAVRLFIDRARSSRPEFSVTDQNAPAVAQVCHQLEGIPLAIELAAARVRVMSVDQIQARLDDRFGLLTGGSRSLQPRQQTLRAAIDWSYDLLSVEERSLLQRLSVFAGGGTLEAVEAVCVGEGIDPADGLDLLGRLVDKSLVLMEEPDAGRPGEEVRYRLLETIRQYARTLLQQNGHLEATRARHRDWCLEFAARAEARLWTAEETVWVERLDAEHDNLRAALEWSREEAGGAEPGLRLAGLLWKFWELRGHVGEGRRWLESALLRREEAPPPARGLPLQGAGNLARDEGDLTRARELYEESLGLLREMGHTRGVANALINLGNVALDEGGYDRAAALYEESLALLRGLGYPPGIALALNNLARVTRCRGDSDRAAALCRESLALYRQMGVKWGIAMALDNLGEVEQARGDLDRAVACHEESMALRREIGATAGVALSLKNLGRVAAARGDPTLAAARCEEALALLRDGGQKPEIADCLCRLADASREQGELERAARLCEEALTMYRHVGSTGGIADCLEQFAAIAAAQGQSERAARLLAAASTQRQGAQPDLTPAERSRWARLQAEARSGLGEAAFTAAWQAGAAMPLEEVVAYVLAADPGSG
jgi:predicted ATPase/class 3 adenylate cyclase